jgi:hypothetical protein
MSRYLFRRYPFRRYAYNGIPPQEEVTFYEYGRRTPKEVVITDNLYDYLPYLKAYEPEPNYALDDQIINQITYRIMTNIIQYKPKRKVEISPVTRVRFNLG